MKWDNRHMSIKQRVEAAMKLALQVARARSKSKNAPFDLTSEWLLEQAEQQDFCCKLTGIKFYSAARAPGRLDPYIPSLDRINASGGYTKDNVRIVIMAINMMMLDWGKEVFDGVISSYQKHQKSER